MKLVFTLISFMAIGGGGLISAVFASRLSRLKNWLSAYLVLVVGLVQLGLIAALDFIEPSHSLYLWLAFIIYNLANICVMIGTTYKKTKYFRSLVDLGGILLAASMVIFLVTSWGNGWSWQIIIFYVAVLTILVSMPIGLVLSRRRKV